MKYRELQAELKRRGLSAYGDTATLKARLAEATQEAPVIQGPILVDPVRADAKTVTIEVTNGEALPEFVFIGDDGKREYTKRVRVGWDDEKDRPIYGTELATKTVDPNNPARIVMSTALDTPPELQRKYQFVLNGEPVQVDNEALAAKLRHNHHFKEV